MWRIPQQSADEVVAAQKLEESMVGGGGEALDDLQVERTATRSDGRSSTTSARILAAILVLLSLNNCKKESRVAYYSNSFCDTRAIEWRHRAQQYGERLSLDAKLVREHQELSKYQLLEADSMYQTFREEGRGVLSLDALGEFFFCQQIHVVDAGTKIVFEMVFTLAAQTYRESPELEEQRGALATMALVLSATNRLPMAD